MVGLFLHPSRDRPATHSTARSGRESVFASVPRWRRIFGHDAGCAQSHDATPLLYCRLLPKPQRAGNRRARPPPAAHHLRPEAIKAQAYPDGPRLLGCTVPVLASLERHPGDRQAGHRDSLAPQGLPPLLAIDLEARSWATADL